MSPQNETNLQPVLDRLLEPFRQIKPDPTCIYSRNHLWLREVHSHLWRVGLDLFAVRILGQITEIIFSRYSSVQAIGARLLWINHMNGVLGLRSPVPAKALHGNRQLREHPALLLSNPMDAGWLLEGDFDLADDTIFLIPRSDLQAWFSQEIEWLGREVEQRLSRKLVSDVGETLSDGGVYITSICSALGPVSHQDLLEQVMNL